MRRRSPLLSLLLVTACSGAATAPTPTFGTWPEPTVGTTQGPVIAPTIPDGPTGVGDPYFPNLGNIGFDVVSYDIELTVDPGLRAITTATTTITASALVDLRRFTLDFRGLEIDAITVDGRASTVQRFPDEILITPATAIRSGDEFVVVVTYHGVPSTIPVESIGFTAGWTVVSDGMYVFAEPEAAHTWFPGSDHPGDKATFRITAAVPAGLAAVANGTLRSVSTADGRATYAWEMEQPMATYLAVLAVGDYRSIAGDATDRIALTDWIPADMDRPSSFGLIPEMLDLYEQWFGPYPFDSYGHVIVSDFPGAMETQTMSLMGRDALAEEIVAHELTHQWFGNSVTPATWQDIWLNEGFATFGEFLWLEHAYGSGVMERYARFLHGGLAFGRANPVSDPGVFGLFGTDVYHRGGLTLLALRRMVGDETMRAILIEYHGRHRHGNATTADFIAIAEEVAARDLGDFFTTWLDSPAPPAFPAG